MPPPPGSRTGTEQRSLGPGVTSGAVQLVSSAGLIVSVTMRAWSTLESAQWIFMRASEPSCEMSQRRTLGSQPSRGEDSSVTARPCDEPTNGHTNEPETGVGIGPRVPSPEQRTDSGRVEPLVEPILRRTEAGQETAHSPLCARPYTGSRHSGSSVLSEPNFGSPKCCFLSWHRTGTSP